MTEAAKQPRFSEDERKIREHIRQDWRQLVADAQLTFEGKETPLTPKADWNLIWVLSGPEISPSDPGEDKEGNQTLDRLRTGLWLLRQVTAVRLGKDVGEVTADDIRDSGPKLYYNGGADAKPNTDRAEGLRQWIADGGLEEHKIPEESIIITKNAEQIRHTGHQFEEFPESLVPKEGKMVVVTDLYHLPRVKRYSRGDYPQLPDDAVLFPAMPGNLRVSRAMSEVHKMPGYIERGVLPPEPNADNEN